MSLIDRIAKLIQANLNDLIDRAEDPEKMIKQVILDMEEELKALKGQVAVAMADRHLLEGKSAENREKMAEWMHKAELCVQKEEEQLARTALERYISYQQLAKEFEGQLTEQDRQVEELKALLGRLEQKLTEARSAGELLMAQHRRARVLNKVSGGGIDPGDAGKPFDQLRQKILHAEAVGRSRIGMMADSPEEKLDRLETDEKIDNLLAELKAHQRPKD